MCVVCCVLCDGWMDCMSIQYKCRVVIVYGVHWMHRVLHLNYIVYSMANAGTRAGTDRHCPVSTYADRYMCR